MNTNTDPVRALIADWRESAAGAKRYSTTDYEDGYAAAESNCANRLESALASAPVGVERLRRMVEKLAAHVRPTCSELWEEAQAALSQQPAAPVLAKYQPCGCVICTCEDEQQCQGCGAKHCGNRADHPPYVGQQPAAPSGEAVLNHPRAFGLMCTVAWTELVQALRKDGHQVNDSSGPNVRKWIESMVRDSLAAPQQPAGVDGDTVRRVAQHIEGVVDYIDMAYPDANTLVAGPILRNMRRWHERLTAALAAQQTAAVDEAPTWSRQQPTVPGIYGIRGFNLCRPASEQFEAVVVVREHGGELVCNLHESTSEDDLESWVPICDLDPDFEWRVFVPGWQQQGGRADG